MYMDVNNTMRNVIKLQYVVRVSFHYDIMFLCCLVHYLFIRVIIVNTASSYAIKLHGKYVLFSVVSKVEVWLNTEDGVPQGGGFCNNPRENSI